MLYKVHSTHGKQSYSQESVLNSLYPSPRDIKAL